MKIISLRTRSYRSWKVAEGLSKEATERLGKLESYQKLRAEGCRPATALSVIGWSRATYYRWRKRYWRRGVRGLESKSRRPHRVSTARWTPADEAAVRRMREKYPFFGKRRLKVMLERDGRHLSESTIGRILKKLVNLNRVKPCRFCRGHVKPRKRRDFSTGHAQRWTWGGREAGLGEMVQVDHMTICRDGRTLKEFRAACPTGKFMTARVYSRATAGNAKRFLEAVIEDLPYPLKSIQVDGGSEFRSEFEDACEALGIPLFVLPPKSPKLNGVVERANDSSRVEFWSQYCGEFNVREAQAALADYQHFYNCIRPHYTLEMMTPMEYIQQCA